jgi:hypothetical protein
MLKPQPPEMKGLALFVRQYPDFLSWMEAEYQRELEKLPFQTAQAAVAQGRCQVWSELVKLFRESPAIAAKH